MVCGRNRLDVVGSGCRTDHSGACIMTPDQIEDEIEYLLLECGNVWFGGQREIIRAAMRTLAYRVSASPVVNVNEGERDGNTSNG